MDFHAVWRLVKSDYFKLGAILALAAFMAFIPNLGYPFVVHIDEWDHIAHSNALMRAGDVYYPDPHSGASSRSLIAKLELGYHVPLAIFQRFSDISWIDISRYFPSVVFIFTVLAVYIFANRMGFGWEAAFFTTLIPTTVGIMGPGLMIPVALGLTFLPILLFLILYEKHIWSYLILTMCVVFLVIMHAASAVVVLSIIVPFVVLGLKSDFKHSAIVVASISFPFLVTLPWTSDLILREASSLLIPKPLPPHHDFITIVTDFGLIPFVFCLIGTFALALKGTKQTYSLIAGLLTIIGLLTIYHSLHYGIGMLYLRGMLFAMLMVGIVAGAGLRELWKLDLSWIPGFKSSNQPISQAISALLVIIVISVTLFTSIPARQSIPFYYMIDKTDYEAFLWIRDNIDSSRQKILIDPWKSTPFTALTGKYVYARIEVAPGDREWQAYDFLRSGSLDTEFLKKNGVSAVYSRVYEWEQNANIEYTVNNPDLVEVRKNVYVLKEKAMN